MDLNQHRGSLGLSMILIIIGYEIQALLSPYQWVVAGIRIINAVPILVEVWSQLFRHTITFSISGPCCYGFYGFVTFLPPIIDMVRDLPSVKFPYPVPFLEENRVIVT